MTQFGIALLSDVNVATYDEGSTAPALQSLLDARLAQLDDLESGNVVAITLAGSGDGNAFSVGIDCSSEPIGTSYEPGSMRLGFFQASSAEELLVAKIPVVERMLLEEPPVDDQVLQQVDDQLVGSAKGNQFMGMLVCVWVDGE